jgi:hypothetical protein
MHKQIENTYNEYLHYSKFIDKVNKNLVEKKNDIAKILMESDFEAEVEQTAFEAFTEVALYKNDLKVIGHKLYTLANAYVDSAMQPELDNTIIKLCQSIEETIPKTNFVVDNNLDSKEKEKGFLKKVKDSQIKSGAIATLLEQYKSMVNV